MDIKEKILKIIKEVETKTGFKVLYNINASKRIVYYYIHPERGSCYSIPMSLIDLISATDVEVEELINSLLYEVKEIKEYE